MSAPVIFSVSQINTYAKAILEEDTHLANLYLSGEISNFVAHRSGHFYFSLKDEHAAIKAVMFKSAADRVRFRPENGMSVVARGRISLYEREGQYQFYAQDLVLDGAGALHLAFLQLKERLEREGLFDQSRKCPLPAYPNAVAVITSPTGAAVQDIMNVLARRFPAASVDFYPVKVQGEGAAAEMIAAIETINLNAAADVMIIGRGGGSLEDLWAFNDEYLARAVAASGVPVISAVGHETDFTICDFAADLRAPTPSAAAELAVPDRVELLQHVASLQTRMTTGAQFLLQHKRMALQLILSKPLMAAPENVMGFQRARLSALIYALRANVQLILNQKSQSAKLAGTRLQAFSPLHVLARGYSITKKDGRIMTAAGQLRAGDEVEIVLSDGSVEAKIM